MHEYWVCIGDYTCDGYVFYNHNYRTKFPERFIKFNTKKSACEYMLKYLEDYVSTHSKYDYSNNTLKDFIKYYNSIGTKFEPKDDKWFMSRYISLRIEKV